MSHRNNWEDPLVVGRGKRPAHVPLGAYPDSASALTCSRKTSPNLRLLNGQWKFLLVPSLDLVPDEFYQPSFDDSAWTEIAVPSNWQLPAVDLPGFKDNPIYINVHYAFDPIPPHVPAENPTGLYRTTFSLDAGWEDRRTILSFEAVDSNCTVWVNGQEVGYSQDSRLPAEFDITPFVVPGENTLAVQVMRYCDGTYLECQDMWRASGIQRDVILYSKPKIGIEDFAVRTLLDDRYENASLVQASITKNPEMADYTVEAMLYDADGAQSFLPRSARRLARAHPGHLSPQQNGLGAYRAANKQAPKVDGRNPLPLPPGADPERSSRASRSTMKQPGRLPAGRNQRRYAAGQRQAPGHARGRPARAPPCPRPRADRR
jgi:beta-galactosidase